MIANKKKGQNDSAQPPESPKPQDAKEIKGTGEIRCHCRRLLAKYTADGAGIQVQCPRCKRTWTFKLGPL